MGNMIMPDGTIFIQLVNFLITIVVLNYLLIKPVRNQIAARSALTASFTSDIEQFSSAAHEKISGYEAALAEARTKAALTREGIKAEGATREQELLKAAHAEASTYLQSSREATAKEAKAAMDSLLSQVDTFANKAMTKILG